MSATRKKNKELAHIGQVIRRIYQNRRQASDGALMDVWDCWDEAVGPAIAANAQPAAFKGTLLLVHVSSSTWIQQLQFFKRDIVAKVNRALGQALVEDIKFKIGPLP